MTLPPAVIVHGLPHALAALVLRWPVTLLSAPGAASYAGCGWWRAVVAAALARHPGMIVLDILDCADAPGRAVEALSVGCKHIVLHPGPAWADVAARAAGLGAVLLPAAPPALDLAQRGAERRLPAWLASGPARDSGPAIG